MPNRAIESYRLRNAATACGSILVPTLLALLAFACSGAPQPVAPLAVAPPAPPSGPPVLTGAETLDRRLNGTAPDPFRLQAEVGWLVQLEVAAVTPLRARLLAPSGREVAVVETPKGSNAPQLLTLLADESGDYRLEVATSESSPANVAYRLRTRAIRPAQAGDRERTEAEKTLTESRRLARLEDEPSLRLALEAALRAKGLWETAGDREGADRARLDAAVLQRQLGALSEARTLAQEARDGAHGRGEARLEALALLTLGEIVLAAGDPVQAWASLDPARTLWTNLASPRELGRTMLAQGLAFPPGEARARSLLEGALEPLRQAGDSDGEARTLGALQPVLAAQGQEAEGRKALDDAIRTGSSGATRTTQSALFAQRAALDRRAGNVAAALAGYQRAAALDRVLGLHRMGLGSLAAVCLAQRDLDEDDEARICYGQLLKESQTLGDAARQAEALIELAEVALRQGRSKDSLAFLERLNPVLRALPEDGQRPYRSRIARDSGVAKRNAGLAQSGLADLRSALSLFPEGDAAADRGERAQVQIQIGVTAQRMGDLEGAKGAFQAASAFAAGAGLERERRRSLFGEASIAFAQKDLETARARIEEALALDAKAGPFAPWERTLPDAESGRHLFYELEVELLMRLQYRESDAGYAERAFELATTARAIDGEERAATRAAIEAGLGDDEALLHYFVGQERSYLFLLTRGSLRTFEVPIRLRELAAKVQRLRSVLASPQTTPRPFLMEAVPLFEVLLGPAESVLAGKSKWIVSAEGPLLTLPFEVLPTDAKESRGKGFAELPYVLRGHIVSYRPWPLAPSATAPAPAGAAPAGSPETKTFLAFAAPLPKALAPPAPRYREEVEEIAARYPLAATEVYLGSDATERRAEGNPVYAAARRIHFAAAALLDSNHPERSGIALTPAIDPSSAEDDGLLDTAEIAAQPLRAELVVLPLCRTARGREVGGEGGFALARAFQKAGARAVVLDLWPLPDAATSGPIPSLYPLLDAGETPAEALRAAKLAVLQAGAADPMYWAPFVLIDTPAPRP